jgi:hypothetical protein
LHHSSRLLPALVAGLAFIAQLADTLVAGLALAAQRTVGRGRDPLLQLLDLEALRLLVLPRFHDGTSLQEW